MAYKSCEDCGSRITSSGLCSYCDEEALIIEQEDREYQEYEAMGYPDEEEIITNFSDEFMERANKQFERAKGRYYRDWETDRKSTRLNSSHSAKSRMPSSA